MKKNDISIVNRWTGQERLGESGKSKNDREREREKEREAEAFEMLPVNHWRTASKCSPSSGSYVNLGSAAVLHAPLHLFNSNGNTLNVSFPVLFTFW